MNYKEFLEQLEVLGKDIDDVAEALDIDVTEIEKWEELEEIPAEAEDWIKEEQDLVDGENEDEDEEDLDEETTED